MTVRCVRLALAANKQKRTNEQKCWRKLELNDVHADSVIN